MTSEESLAALKAISEEKNPYEFTPDEWRTLNDEQKEDRYVLIHQWKKEQEARWLEAVHNIVPKVGLGCTIIYYSDKRAATETRIISPSKIEVAHNAVRCLNYYAGEYEILPELQERTAIFTKRSNGKWIMQGHKSKDGLRLVLHYQHHYIDPSF